MEASKTNSQEDFLKLLVKNEEDRYISYKKMLEDTFKHKEFFPIGDELSEWYKALLREEKNSSESRLKSLREELTDIRQGMNPAFLYKYKKATVYVASFSKEGAPVTLENKLDEILFKSK